MNKSEFLKKLKEKISDKVIELIVVGMVIISTFFLKSGINTGVVFITAEVKKELDKDRKTDSIRYALFVDSFVQYAAPLKGDLEYLVKAEKTKILESLDLAEEINKISVKIDSLSKKEVFEFDTLNLTRKEDIRELYLIMKQQQQALLFQQKRDSILLEYDKEKQMLYEQSSAELRRLLKSLPK